MKESKNYFFVRDVLRALGGRKSRAVANVVIAYDPMLQIKGRIVAKLSSRLETENPFRHLK